MLAAGGYFLLLKVSACSLLLLNACFCLLECLLLPSACLCLWCVVLAVVLLAACFSASYFPRLVWHSAYTLLAQLVASPCSPARHISVESAHLVVCVFACCIRPVVRRPVPSCRRLLRATVRRGSTDDSQT